MIETTLPAKRAISEIVHAYRMIQGDDKRPLSLRDFSQALSDILEPYGGSVSHQSVKNWEDRTHLPHHFFMMQIVFHAPMDWRRDFAQDVLAALNPKLYQPATDIGRRAIENGQKEIIRFRSSSTAARHISSSNGTQP
ncbi:MAG: hypothetical protein JXB38_17110 [Anaerolineales bacterium]|nr:hypothetical protein [Anaerolineales bacterium]